MSFWLFVFGALFGSFVNVIATRYDPDRPLFSSTTLGGRSRCPHCEKRLRWFELIPFVSFASQGGRCRTCRARLSLQYPFIELLSGLIFVFVPRHLAEPNAYLQFPASGADLLAFGALWILVFEIMLLMSLIDVRLKIIPDEIHLFLLAAGIALGVYGQPAFMQGAGSFIGPSALIFGLHDSILVNRLVAFVVTVSFFALIVLATRSRGMGMGDVKLIAALSLVFGWPDAAILAAFAFLIGGAAGAVLMAIGKKTRKSSVPFGPFLALGAAALFFFGGTIVNAYFSFLAG